MASELKLSGTTARVILQGNDTITSDQTFTFPNSGGELLTDAANDNTGTGGSSGSAQVVGYQQGITTCAVNNAVTLYSNYNKLWFTRVGNLVTIGGQIRVEDGDDGTKALVINNLPYNSIATEGPSFSTGSLRIYEGSFMNNGEWAIVITDKNSPTLYFAFCRDNNSDASVKATTDAYYALGISYLTEDTSWAPNSGSVLS